MDDVCRFAYMKPQRHILTFEVDEDFRKHLVEKSKENNRSLSSYIRAALKKISKYREELV